MLWINAICRWTIALFVLVNLLFSAAKAVSTESIRDDSYAALAQGELKSVALTSNGYLQPTYARKLIGVTGTELIWDVVRDKNGSLLCATGHGGRLIRIKSDGTTHSVATLREAELTALAPLPDGGFLVAAAPSGRLYRVGADDQVTTLTKLPVTFVWRLVPDGEGNILALTGSEGRIFRLSIEKGNSIEVTQLAQLKSKNLLSVWRDVKGEYGERGAIYIGGQDPGWLYRLRPGRKEAEVLFNSGADEIRGIRPIEEGLALALNNERAPSGQALQMTLRMGNAGMGGPMMMRAPQILNPPAGGDEEAAKGMAAAFALGQQRSQGGSKMVILRRNGFSRALWSSPESPIHDLVVGPRGNLLAAAGNQGHVFEIKPTGEHAIVVDVRDDYVLRMIEDQQGFLLACARNGAAYEMSRKVADQIVYLSRALDAGSPVHWGKFYVRGGENAGTTESVERDLRAVSVAFRTGNDGDIDSDLWSDWSDEQAARHEIPLQLPNRVARYLQYRITMEPARGRDNILQIDDTEAFFAEPNAAPVVGHINVAHGGPGGGGGAPKPPQMPGQPGNPPATGQPAPVASEAPTEGGREAHSNSMMLNITWRATDPNNDTLRYMLYFKGRDESTWKLIDDKLAAPQMALNVGGVADGYYRFRVVASDELDNSQGDGLSEERISDEVTIDNTAPDIERLLASTRGEKALLSCTINDDLSIISDLKVDIDNKDSYPVFPMDGIFDERSEKFEWQTPALPPGEHTATLNATDREGNTSTAKVVFHIKARDAKRSRRGME